MDRRRPSPQILGFGVLALVVAVGCAPTDGRSGSGSGGASATGGSGQTTGSGGSGQSGGSPAAGGATGAGGAGATGGSTGTGGSSPVGATGGSGGKGGSGAGTGGAGGKGTGGAAGSAGAKGTGGATSTGGVTGTGGATGSGGAAGGTTVCGSGAEDSNVTLSCPSGETIDKVTFASFGTPTGSCGSFAAGACNASSSQAVVEALCIGRQSCSVPADNGAFTDPCDKTTKSLSIQVTCTVGGGMEPPSAGQQPFKGFAGDPNACTDLQHLRTSWFYNWEQTDDKKCASTNDPFVPMIWGHTGSEQSASGITGAVSSFVGKGNGYVLGFNEPDNSTQSNIPVATAVQLWPSFTNSAILIGSPATQGNSTGQTWFGSFMSSVNGSSTLRADFIALHWYGWNAGSCDAAASQLESYLKWAEGFSGNRPLWLTEWGCLNDSAPDVSTVVNFYNGALAVFARHPRVQRYSWYPWSTNLDLVNSDGSLTTLGQAYAAAPAYK
ncbi:MAG TPA: glycosyl hydrolase [Polyangia bacterium]|nr:glycosyl hydrolase [Polyangia bacterium]